MGTIAANNAASAADDDACPDEVRAAFAANDNDPIFPIFDRTNPGGLVEEIVDWLVSSSERPCRELALSATLPFVGALIGRRFSGWLDCRSNLYVAALAPSGRGKDHSRKQLKRLATAAGVDKVIGPSRIMSASGLRDTLMSAPSCVMMVDEFGGPMSAWLDRKSSAHITAIKDDLLDYFSAASSTFDGAAYAGKPAVKLHNPNLCVYGTSTPEPFWGAITGLNTTDGFLARWLVFEAPKRAPRLVQGPPDVRDVPAALVDKVRALAQAGRGGGNLDTLASDCGDKPVDDVRVPYDLDAQAVLKMFTEDNERDRLSAADAMEEAVLGRVREHAVKLALVVAVATNPAAPAVTASMMHWGIRIAMGSADTLIEQARDYVADSRREEQRNALVRLIKGAGSAGITEAVMTNKTPGIDKRTRAELLEEIYAGGLAHWDFGTRPYRGVLPKVWRAGGGGAGAP